MANINDQNQAHARYDAVYGSASNATDIGKLARAPLLGIGRAFQAVGWRIYRSARERTVQQWVRDAGDRTLRLDYPLQEDSLVFDLGGYEGQWASDIFARYQCNVWVFEPVPEYAAKIRDRFKRNSKITVFEFGLSDADKTMPLQISADGSSMYKKRGKHKIDIRLVDVAEFMREHEVAKVDLMKINIEGGEYDLLDRVLAAGIANQFFDIQVQFHDFVPGAPGRVRAIQAGLANSHAPAYCYPFVWENWTRRAQL